MKYMKYSENQFFLFKIDGILKNEDDYCFCTSFQPFLSVYNIEV